MCYIWKWKFCRTTKYKANNISCDEMNELEVSTQRPSGWVAESYRPAVGLSFCNGPRRPYLRVLGEPWQRQTSLVMPNSIHKITEVYRRPNALHLSEGIMIYTQVWFLLFFTPHTSFQILQRNTILYKVVQFLQLTSAVFLHNSKWSYCIRFGSRCTHCVTL